MNGKSENADRFGAFSGFSFIRTLGCGGSSAGDPANDSGLRWIERHPGPRTHTEEEKSPLSLQHRTQFAGIRGSLARFRVSEPTRDTRDEIFTRIRLRSSEKWTSASPPSPKSPEVWKVGRTTTVL